MANKKVRETKSKTKKETKSKVKSKPETKQIIEDREDIIVKEITNEIKKEEKPKVDLSFKTIKIFARSPMCFSMLNENNGKEIVLDIPTKGKLITKEQLKHLIEERLSTLLCGNLYFEKNDIKKVIEFSQGIISDDNSTKLISNKEIDEIVENGFGEFEELAKEVKDNEFILRYIFNKMRKNESYGDRPLQNYMRDRLLRNRYKDLKNREKEMRK